MDSTIVVRMFEEELEKLDKEYSEITQNHTERFGDELELKALINYANYYLEPHIYPHCSVNTAERNLW